MTRRGPGRDVAGTAVTTALFGRTRAGRTAVVDTTSGRRLTYGGLTAAVWSAAAGLARCGLRHGEVVAVHLPDVPELVLALHAVTAAGGVPTPVRPGSSAGDLARQLADSGARALITWPVLLDTAIRAAEKAPVEWLFCFGAERDAMPFTSLFTAGSPRGVPAEDPERDLALLPYTKGTTRAPAAVRLTHRAVVTGIRAIARTGLVAASDVAASELPLTDVIAMQTILNPALAVGARVVTQAGRGRLELLKLLQDGGVTVALLSPETVEDLAFHRAVKCYDLSALRTVICAGSGLDPDSALACEERIGCVVRPAYGLAEAGGLTHVAVTEAAPGSVGTCLPHIEAQIIDQATGAARAPFDLGELYVRNPAAIPGWIHTGDRAFVDDDGRYFIVGRLVDPGRDRRRRAPVERSRAYRLEEGWW